MNKLSVVIIEGEIPAVHLPHPIVPGLRPQWILTVILGNTDEVVAWFHEHPHPDLIFLDIHLADGNVFNFLSAMHPSFAVAFTIVYDQYAIRAPTINSIDYILKSIDKKRLLEATVKYESLLNNKVPRPEDYLGVPLKTLRHKEKCYRIRLLISGVDRSWSLQAADIAYFYSENKVTFAVTRKGQEYITNLSLNKLVEQLDPECFFCANRQVFVNIDAIDHAEPFFNGEIIVIVRPSYKSKITISEEKLSAFKLWLNH